MTAYQQSGIWGPHNPGQSGKASPADARRTNRSLIFSLLFPDVQLSRAELGRRTGLSRVAVSDVVNSMLSCHLLRENGRESNGGKGKRGTLLSVDPDTLHIISIDLSQPHLIQGEATNLLGEPVMHVEHALRAVNHVDFDTINEVITPLHAATQNVIGIGLAMPGVVDGNGLVKRSTLLGWRNVDVRTPIERRFSLPVTVNNDATAAMFTERLFGKGGPNMMFVRLRRGVGGAVLLGDVPVFGENHAGGEIGHISLDPQGPPCACGKRGCLERLVSATSLHARLQRSDERMRASILREAGTYLGRRVRVRAERHRQRHPAVGRAGAARPADRLVVPHADHHPPMRVRGRNHPAWRSPISPPRLPGKPLIKLRAASRQREDLDFQRAAATAARTTSRSVRHTMTPLPPPPGPPSDVIVRFADK